MRLLQLPNQGTPLTDFGVRLNDALAENADRDIVGDPEGTAYGFTERGMHIF